MGGDAGLLGLGARDGRRCLERTLELARDRASHAAEERDLVVGVLDLAPRRDRRDLWGLARGRVYGAPARGRGRGWSRGRLRGADEVAPDLADASDGLPDLVFQVAALNEGHAEQDRTQGRHAPIGHEAVDERALLLDPPNVIEGLLQGPQEGDDREEEEHEERDPGHAAAALEVDRQLVEPLGQGRGLLGRGRDGVDQEGLEATSRLLQPADREDRDHDGEGRDQGQHRGVGQRHRLVLRPRGDEAAAHEVEQAQALDDPTLNRREGAEVPLPHGLAEELADRLGRRLLGAGPELGQDLPDDSLGVGPS